ncbi:MAG: bifunctional precorrin-2 dehydrogenase/sirohydrochlorin ferrochelatase [Candidatus Omnitrophica bacterium]|nr:bifunctional precorrin-2 dehydrogenase/sirohydrochlorin ferrochelatase [Candidatus Omnitrophota bacterium]
MSDKVYYPLFADLQGRCCVVVGGGLVAQRKVTTLLRFGARVTVVSPHATQRLLRHAAKRTITHIARRFRPTDLRGAWLVYAATDDHAINQAVYRTATRARILTNVVDEPSLCSFIAPSIAKRGEVVIAVSTGGGSPTLAKQLRRDVEQTVGGHYAAMLRLLRSLRDAAKRRLPSYRDRKRYFRRLVEGRAFDLIRRGQPRAARHEALKLLQNGGALR